MRLKVLTAAILALPTLAAADTMIVNANGYTLNSRNEVVQFKALAFDDNGRILAVGSVADVGAKAPSARQVDMQGRTVIPGLIDAHGHIFGLGEMISELDLTTSVSLQGAQDAVAAYAKANAGSPWLVGRGWNQEIWKLGRFPTAAELDKVESTRPVVLSRVDGHATWVNTKALQLAGITDQTPDPAGGKIMRDATGKATGILVDAASALVDKHIPKKTEAQARAVLDKSLARIAAMGLTSVHDAGMGVAEDQLYREYASNGKLTTRVVAMIGDTGKDFDILAAKGPVLNFGKDKAYTMRSVKLYSDGALGSRGAAMIAPYSDEAKTHGLLFRKAGDIHAMMEKAMKKGFQVNVHAIGDAGNRQVLDGFARLVKQTGTQNLRHRIEHAQVVAPSDIPRFKTIGIIPSMQPTHATSDMNMAEARVGAERIKGAYAWRTFLHQGSRVACGSDFPVESPNPFFGLHAAVTRQDAAGKPVAGWYPNEAMSLKEALRCFTLDAAWAGHQEKDTGSLEVGKYADFIVIDHDLFTMPTYDIHKVGVLQTWMGGRQVYEKK